MFIVSLAVASPTVVNTPTAPHYHWTQFNIRAAGSPLVLPALPLDGDSTPESGAGGATAPTLRQRGRS